jgi:uncharacterized protein (DUF4415 family)
VSEERIIRRTLTPRREKTDAEWAAFDALTDAEIAAAVADDPDAAPFADLDWTKDIRIVEPPAKQAISIRIDGDVLAWFRTNSDRYQSKINAVLRAYMEREKKSA